MLGSPRCYIVKELGVYNRNFIRSNDYVRYITQLIYQSSGALVVKFHACLDYCNCVILVLVIKDYSSVAVLSTK